MKRNRIMSDMNEVWKDIKDYEGLYQVSNLGHIRTLNYRQRVGEVRIMSLLKRSGHLHAVLSKKGCKEKRPLVHRLVFEAFYRRLLPNEVVHHLNLQKTCNIWTNLVAWDETRHKQFHMRGNLFNVGKHQSQETKDKVKATKIKNGTWCKKCSEETKQKLSEAKKGTHPSQQTRKKLSETAKGRVISQQTKQKMSISLKGKVPWNKGKKTGPRSEETKQKISLSHKRRKINNESTSF